MRFDPALLPGGGTANPAAAEDGVVPPGEPVPNDNYRLNETHRLLTFLVPATAHVTVLTRDAGSPNGTPIKADELARNVNGGRPTAPVPTGQIAAWCRCASAPRSR